MAKYTQAEWLLYTPEGRAAKMRTMRDSFRGSPGTFLDNAYRVGYSQPYEASVNAEAIRAAYLAPPKTPVDRFIDAHPALPPDVVAFLHAHPDYLFKFEASPALTMAQINAEIAASNNSGGLMGFLDKAAPLVTMALAAYVGAGFFPGASAAAPANPVSFSADLAASKAATAASISTAPISNAALLTSISPTAGAVNASLTAASLTDAAIASGLNAAGVGAAATVSASNVFSLLDNVPTMGGANAGAAGNVLSTTGAADMSIFTDLGGAIKDVGSGLVDAYGGVLDVQVKRAQLDALAAQQKAAAQPTLFAQTGGGINWPMIGVGLAALLGVVFLVRR